MSDLILGFDCKDCLHFSETGMSMIPDMSSHVITEPQVSTELNPEAHTQLAEEKPVDSSHEILNAFESHGLMLNHILKDMLNEGEAHQGGRKGSGFTQSSRHLASFISRPRSRDDLALFDTEFRNSIENELYDKYYDEEPEGVWREMLLKRGIEEIPANMQFEESKLMAGLIADIVKPKSADDLKGVIPLPNVDKDLRIGTCTTAESYFLEYLNDPAILGGGGFGEFNIIVGDDGTPLMIEKMGYGEDHSSLTLKPVLINGVELPAGSLIGIDRSVDTPSKSLPDRSGNIISVNDCKGFQFLRLTTLAVSPQNRERAFGNHIKFQAENSAVMPGYDTSSIDDFALKANRLVIAQASNGVIY